MSRGRVWSLGLALVAAVGLSQLTPQPADREAPAEPDASPGPDVRRILPAAGEGVPGAGAAVIEGRAGSVRVDFGEAPEPTPARIAAPEAQRVAGSFLEANALQSEGLEVRRVHRRAFQVEGGLAWGYAVDLVDPWRARAERVFVGGDGRPLGRVSLIHTAGLADVYARSPLDGFTTEVALTGMGDPDLLESDWGAVSNCIDVGAAACYLTSLAAPDLAGNWRFTPDPLDPEDAFAEVNAYHQLEVGRARFAELGLAPFARPFLAVVNFRIDRDYDGVIDPFTNAMFVREYWPGHDALIFGQGEHGDLAYDATVVHHELAHLATSFVDMYGGLDLHGLNQMPLALAEGYADYFAATIAGDPVIGPYLGTIDSGPEDWLRRLDEDLACPGDLLGEGHLDGRIWSGALWRAREELGPELDHAVVAGIRALPDSPNLQQAAAATRAAVSAHLGEEAATRFEAHLEAAGIAACSRVLPLTLPGEARGFMPVTFQLPGISPAATQYLIVPPPGASRVVLRIEPVATADTGGDTATGPDTGPDTADTGAAPAGRVYVRAGVPVTYNGTQGLQAGASINYDAASTGGELVLTRDTEPALAPGSEIYVSPANEGKRTFLYRLSAEVEYAPAVERVAVAEDVPELQAEVAPEGDTPILPIGGGCSVAVGGATGGGRGDGVGGSASAAGGSGPGGGALTLVLIVGAALLLGRRRRARA